MLIHQQMAGWWFLCSFNPCEKYESQIGMIIPNILWKIKNVPNHQPAMVF
jgi:hypothetical protein